IYESDTPLKRTFGKRHRCEVAVKRPFEVKRTDSGKTTDTGLKKYWYDYFGEPPAPQQNANGGSKPTPKPVSEAPASVKNAAAGRHPDDEVIGFTEEAAKLF